MFKELHGATILGSEGEALIKILVLTLNKRGVNWISGHKTGKGQFSFQSQRKAMPKNAQATAQLHSSHTLVK